ncbi:helix-turn-helix transcriptional regulator [Clostridium sp. CX1]|uniref:helix-turn-helix domain-containing protein n=1 Tax=Clostridium sp. CX1 TaxID=2978346 RepID=UPI0021C0B0DA|nr:helix-turn-helix transcriptional regulator [Clostridium sp. CX1]MCT8978271.1 helix-turn-helix transcriptional regulator [Clostridium sp. CX1]
MFNRRKLIEIMEEKSITAYKLWKVSGVAQSTISDILNKENKNPTTKTLQKIADALGVSIDEFFKEDDSNEVPKESDAKNTGIDTIAAHLEGKQLTPEKIKEITKYIDFLFHDEDD